jgi:hypothetical protein
LTCKNARDYSKFLLQEIHFLSKKEEKEKNKLNYFLDIMLYIQAKIHPNIYPKINPRTTKIIALTKSKVVIFQYGSNECNLNTQSKNDCKVPGITAIKKAHTACSAATNIPTTNPALFLFMFFI